jgi:hypothetical protein
MQGFLTQFAGRAFEPEAVMILTGAFDDAWAKVQASNAPWAAEDYAMAGRTIIALHIIKTAKAGNLNRHALADGALMYLTEQKLHKTPLIWLP